MNIENETLSETLIHPTTQMGHVSLTVSSLKNQVAFYQQALGFSLHWQEDHSAGLGVGGADLLRLVEQPNVKRYQRVTGLYHFAGLVSDRRELARAITRLFSRGITHYPTDHIMTKSTYLSDPEGNGIELYTESPEDGWMGIETGNSSPGARMAASTMAVRHWMSTHSSDT